MKKLFKLGVFAFFILLLSACDASEKQEIYTTVYPIHFLVEQLFGTHSNISSIYPTGVNTLDYQLTDRLVDTYSQGDFFIYNGKTEEKQIAKTLVNKRKKLKIVDVAYGLKMSYGIEEFWLSPSNFLMLATNLKDGLEDQIGTKYIHEEMDAKFHEIEETLSIMDADMRSTAKNAKNRNQNTIIVSSDVFKFLNDYGFSILSLEDYEIGTSNFEALKNKFQSGAYKYLLIRDKDKDQAIVKALSDAKAQVVTVNTMTTLSEEDQKNNNNYFTIMNEFISNLKNITNY